MPEKQRTPPPRYSLEDHQMYQNHDVRKFQVFLT